MNFAEFNAAIEDDTIREIILVAEARQSKVLSRIADDICARPGVRLVLLAGGSSAGKTTTAKRLATQLRVNEREVLLLSTDDYFVGDKKNPRDENGKLDYEHIDCVDRPQLAADINALLAGEDIAERRFDFVRHAPAYSGERLALKPGGIVLVEGIHALNPVLTEGVDDRAKYRVYISPEPCLDVLDGIRPSAQESRFLRRLVRDNHFRKVPPTDTLERWPSVLAGEAKWIEPFRPLADATFNSYLIYELSVLKPYVGGLLVWIQREVGEDRLVMNMLQLLKHLTPLDSTLVPGDSILRETIGGSQLEY